MPTAEDYSYILGMNRTPDPPGTREPTALDAAAILAGWGLREVEGGVEKAFGVGANIMDLASRPDYAVWNVLHAAQEGRINLDSFISDIGREVGKGLSPKSAEDRGSFTNIVQTAVQQRARALATGKRKIDFTDLVLFGLPEKALNLGIEGLGLAGDVVLSPTDKVAKVVKLGDKYNNVIDWASGKIRQAGETPWEAVSTRAKFLDPDIPDNTPKEQKAAIFASDAAKIGGTQAADAFARQMA
jgi:hypothetical protein